MNKNNEDFIDRAFRKVYYDTSNAGSYGGIDKLVDAVHTDLQGIVSTKEIRRRAKQWLKTQDTYTLHRPIRRNFQRNATVVYGIDDQWQADLVDMQEWRNENRGYNYLLTCIDIFSKYAWVRPLKSKSGTDVVKAFSSIFDDPNTESAIRKNRFPRALQTDKGKEFFNNSARRLFQDYEIEHFATENETKAAVIERFNRTLKTKMWRYFTEMGNHDYISVLPQFLQSYNASKHRTIGMAPREVLPEHEKTLWNRMYGSKEKPDDFKFEIGELVRISKFKAHFEKGYHSNWTDEIFKIVARSKGKPRSIYKLSDVEGEAISGSFYEDELQVIDKDLDRGAFEIERVIRKRRNPTTKKSEILVKWKGWPDKFNSWIPGNNVRRYQ